MEMDGVTEADVDIDAVSEPVADELGTVNSILHGSPDAVNGMSECKS